MENTDLPPEQPFRPAARAGPRRLGAPGLPPSTHPSHASSFASQHTQESLNVQTVTKSGYIPSSASNSRADDSFGSRSGPGPDSEPPPPSPATSRGTRGHSGEEGTNYSGAMDHLSHGGSTVEESESTAHASSVGAGPRSSREASSSRRIYQPRQAPGPQPLRGVDTVKEAPAPATSTTYGGGGSGVGAGAGTINEDGDGAHQSNSNVTFSTRTLAVAGIAVLFVIGLLIGLLFALRGGDSDVVYVTSSPSLKGTISPTPSPTPPTIVPTAVTPSPTMETVPTTGNPTAAPTVEGVSVTLSRIISRGSVVCAVSTQEGYNSINLGTGEREGFEIDLARAISAAIFGNDTPVSFTDVPFSDRFTALNSTEVDVVIASATITMERDLLEPTTGTGFTFSTPYLYNGLSFGGVPGFVNCADQLNVTEACSELRVCVLDGTTHLDRVIQLLPGVSVVRAPSVDALYQNFIDGFCNTLAGEQFEVAEAVVRAAGYTGNYLVGTSVFSKEPLAIVTRDDDPTFSDFVNWILQALLAAEEQGITQATASSFTKSDVFGARFENMFVNAIAAAGNYAEIYERHLEAMVPRKTINTINEGDSGLIFSFPFGKIDGTGPGPASGGTLQTIIDRGHLRCGVTRRASFAEFDSASQTWSGLDVDYCRALSAAIFSGVSNTVVYRNLPATERFTALATGDVDVLSRITTVTMARDVFEPAAMVGFSFAQPNFYDGLSFGGIPPYGQCADNLDTTSEECRDLKICVNDGTTNIERLRQLFPEEYIVAKATGELALQGLVSGDCQVVAGGVHDVSSGSVREVGGYTAEYENGANRFSKDPLALVTRQDDPQWTSFVYWVVSATFYAEEEGISRGSSDQMPITNLFGVLYGRLLRDAIQAVGSYGLIYSRNVAGLVPRGGLNLLNSNPFGPQHYPLPGL